MGGEAAKAIEYDHEDKSKACVKLLVLGFAGDTNP